MDGISTIVIGAGVIGCLVARELAARDSQAEVTVLDRDAVGAGASRRSAGLHLPRGSTPRIRRMSAYSHAYYEDLRLRDPGIPIHGVAALVVSPGPGRGPEGRYLDLVDAVPASLAQSRTVAVPDGASAWQIGGCHYADVYQLSQVIAAQLRPRVRFLEGVEVTGLASAGGAVTVQVGTGQRLAADAAVLAPGPWLAAPAWRDLLAPLRLRVKKIVALHIEQRPRPDDEVVVFEDTDAFLLPLAHRGHWLFSYTCQDWDVDPDRMTAGLSAAELGDARACLRRYSPVLADACVAGRVFCDAYSPDGEPVVRTVDGADRIVFAGAANGSGYRLAPAMGAEVVDLLQLQRSEGVTGDHQYV